MSTICAISTPRGLGGLGVIRVSGEKAVEICAEIVRMSRMTLSQAEPNHMYFARIADAAQTVDEIMVTVFRAPHSFTGEDSVELSCHGGMFILNRVMQLLLRHGCVPAAAGEFTRRAFMNGKLDLTQAEAVIDLIHSQSALQADCALHQLDGRLGRKIEQLRKVLMEINTEIMAYVDYPEETIGEIDETSIFERLKTTARELDGIVSSYADGQVIREGIATAIIGRPNVGKSTLMNALLQRDKSIVTEIAGTTRDLVEDTAVLGDLVLRLTDTAGIRNTEDTVEKIGVQRARLAAQKAQLVLAVVDASRPLSGEDTEIFELCRGKTVIGILNKTDLSVCVTPSQLPFEQVVSVSAREENGLQPLAKKIKSLFLSDQMGEDTEILTNARQFAAVQTAANAVRDSVQAMQAGFTPDLVSVDITHAAEALGEVTGKEVRQQMIDDIFSRFCVGK